MAKAKSTGKARSYCFVSRGAGASVSLSSGRTRSGAPTQLFRKELIRDGEYVKATDGIRFRVTPQLREHWVNTFLSMKQDGVKVNVPAGHRNASDPAKNFGWLVGLENEGASLYGKLKLVGEDAMLAAARNDVSVYVPAEFTAGNGKTYKRPITHVSLCPDPVIPGLGEFEAIAASLSDGKETTMMDWSKIAAALHIEEDMSKMSFEEAEKLVLKAIEDATVSDEEEPAPAPEAKPVSAQLLKLSRENREHKLDALVASAKITPAVRDKLTKQYLDKTHLTLVLSREDDGFDDGFDDLVETLGENDPVELGEASRAQLLELSRTGGGDKDKDVLSKDAEARAKAAKGE